MRHELDTEHPSLSARTQWQYEALLQHHDPRYYPDTILGAERTICHGTKLRNTFDSRECMRRQSLASCHEGWLTRTTH